MDQSPNRIAARRWPNRQTDEPTRSAIRCESLESRILFNVVIDHSSQNYFNAVAITPHETVLTGHKITLRMDGNGQGIDAVVDRHTFQPVPFGTSGNLIVHGERRSSDSLTLDLRGGNLLRGSTTIDDPSGSESVNILGGNQNDCISIGHNRLTIGAASISMFGVRSVSYTNPGGNDTINLSGAIPATLNLASGNSTVTNSDTAPVYVAAGTGKTTINATAGTTIIPANSGTGIQQLAFAAINISAGAKVVFANTNATLGNYSNHANRTLAIVDAGGLNIATGGTLDLGDNSMLLKYLAANKSATDSMISSLVTSGSAGGAWSGTGITSSEANFDAFNGAAARAVGWADQLDVGVNSFEGDSADVADGNEIMIKFTYYGDTDLDGRVASSDSANFSTGVHLTGNAYWEFGDFDYSGGKPTASDSQAFSTGLAAYKTFGLL